MTSASRRLSRRAVLKGGAALACTATPLARVAAAEVVPLRAGVTIITGLGGNVVHYAAGTAAVLVDSGAAGRAETLLDLLGELPGREIRALLNTHWHLDQVGGNAAIGRTGARIIAHAKTRAHLTTPYYLPDEDRYQAPLPREAHPTESFFAEGALELEGRAIRYGYLLAAHTDGDIFIQFEDANVIAAGDAISPERDPVLDWYGGGWLGGRVDSLALLLRASDAETRFVPSYGPVVDRHYVQAEHDLMQGLYDIFFERVRAGESAEDIHRSGALDALARRFDDPMKLLYDAHKSFWGHYSTLSHDIV